MSHSSHIPLAAKPVLAALHDVGSNNHASPDEKARSTRVLAKRLKTLKKSSPKWSIILTLLATAGVVAATAYARKHGIRIPDNLKKFTKHAHNTILTSRSAAAKALKNKSKIIVNSTRRAAVKATGAKPTVTFGNRLAFWRTKEAGWGDVRAALRSSTWGKLKRK
jgi:RNase P subunit RPR2